MKRFKRDQRSSGQMNRIVDDTRVSDVQMKLGYDKRHLVAKYVYVNEIE